MGEARDLDAVSAELYGGAPADFVARRDELAKQARADGDRDLATAIKGLRRPTVGAWYLNVAASAGLTSLRELLDLGRELREKQAAGDFAALRDLAGRRGPLVNRVLRDLTAHLAQVGVSATGSALDEVRTTLGAALADPAVDAQVRAGRVDRAHSYGGFGEVEMAVPTPSAVGTAKGPHGKESQGKESQGKESQGKESQKKDNTAAREQLAAARRELATAERERAAVESRAREATATVRAARKRVESLETELDRARDALSKAEDEASGLKARVADLAATIEQARAALATG